MRLRDHINVIRAVSNRQRPFRRVGRLHHLNQLLFLLWRHSTRNNRFTQLNQARELLKKVLVQQIHKRVAGNHQTIALLLFIIAVFLRLFLNHLQHRLKRLDFLILPQFLRGKHRILPPFRVRRDRHPFLESEVFFEIKNYFMVVQILQIKLKHAVLLLYQIYRLT